MSDTEGTTPDLVPHVDEYGRPDCDCGIEQVTAIQQQLLTWFDQWRGDKAYRDHDEVIGWAEKLTAPLLSAVASLTQLERGATEQVVALSEALAETRRERNAARKQAEQAQSVVAAAQAAVADILELHPYVRDDKTGWLRESTHALVAAVDALATSAPQPKDTLVCGRSLTEGWCPDHLTGTPPAAAPQPKDAEPKPPACADCGHRHHAGGGHADHVWRDSCAYNAGTDCSAAPVVEPMPQNDGGYWQYATRWIDGRVTGKLADHRTPDLPIRVCENERSRGQQVPEVVRRRVGPWAPAAAVPSSGGEPCDSMSAHDPHDRCPGLRSAFTELFPHEEESSGQDTAADEPHCCGCDREYDTWCNCACHHAKPTPVFCPRTGKLGPDDDGCAPGTHQPMPAVVRQPGHPLHPHGCCDPTWPTPSQADLFRALFGVDAKPVTTGGADPCGKCGGRGTHYSDCRTQATAGGTASSEPELAECQATGTCCGTCIHDLGACCKHSTASSGQGEVRHYSTCGLDCPGHAAPVSAAGVTTDSEVRP